MSRLFLIKNPDLFQGEEYLNKNKNYFEGWYFKNTNHEKGISFIPGINISNKGKKAFIQVITNDSSYFVNFDINDFKFNFEPFYIKVGENYFTKEGIKINIKDDRQNLKVWGEVKYSDSKNLNTNIFLPNIMGPFSYVPFMECNHAILSMKNKISGLININNNEIKFNNDMGYIEKDWGCSFPKSYIWCQGNSFKNTNASFMLSIADIPFKMFNFKGLISVLIIDNKEYRFATYNNAKVIKYDIDNDMINIVLKKGSYYLEIKSKYNKGQKLSAPVKGNMDKDILETITAIVTVTLRKDDKVIFSDTSTNCGLELVKE